MKFIAVFMKYLYITFHRPCFIYLLFVTFTQQLTHRSQVCDVNVLHQGTKEVLRSSFHAETCESPTLSGAVTAPNSETLMENVLSFLTMGKVVLFYNRASGLKVFRSKQRTEKHGRVWCNHIYFWKRKGI